MRFRAAVLRRFGSLSVEEIEMRSLEAGQVLVEMTMSGLCRSQLMEVRGLRGEDRWVPHLLGHEGIGIVREIGPGVTRFKPGDEVVLTWIKGEGLNAEPIIFESELGHINAGPVTTLSEFTVVSENRLFEKPALLGDLESVLLGCALPTGAGMAMKGVSERRNPSVLVLGLGGVGMAALLTLRALGVDTVIAADSSAMKTKWAREQGVELTVAGSINEIRSYVAELHPSGVDLVLESAGSASTIEGAFSMLNSAGQLIFASHPPTGDRISLDPHALIQGRRIRGTWGGDFNPHLDSKTLVELFMNSDVNIKSMASVPRPLEEVNALLDLLEDGLSMRPMISMNFSSNG
jgi:S-(hydroxymethyl)glutathione dehydrogenase/alcohol dehydrogenase